jgi:hypothetical protein
VAEVARRRSGLVTTIAILHLIGGGLGLIGSLCGGVLLLIAAIATPGAAGGGPPTAQQIQAHMTANAAGYQAYQVSGLAVGLVLDMLLLTSGMGLLTLQPWARWTSIVYAVLSLIYKAANILYALLVANPVMKAFVEGEARRMPPGQAESYEMISMWSLYGSVCGQAVFIVYPIAVLIVMLLPSTGRQFEYGGQRRLDAIREDDRPPDRWRD